MVKLTRVSSRTNKSRTRRNKRGGSTVAIPPEELQIYKRVANGTTWHEVLGVGKDATVKDVKREIRNLGPHIHPEGALAKRYLTNETSTELFARASDAFSWRTQCAPDIPDRAPGCKAWTASPVDISSISKSKVAPQQSKAEFMKNAEPQPQSKPQPRSQPMPEADPKAQMSPEKVRFKEAVLNSSKLGVKVGWVPVEKTLNRSHPLSSGFPKWTMAVQWKLNPDSEYALNDIILKVIPTEGGWPEWNRKKLLLRKDPLPDIPLDWQSEDNGWQEDDGNWVYRLIHINGSVLFMGGRQGVITKWPTFMKPPL